MSDNDIIKALECCAKYESCPFCPCDNYCSGSAGLKESALKLILRQRTQIEDLQEAKADLNETVKNLLKLLVDFKAEAIKEFAERLENDLGALFLVNHPIVGSMIDNLVKEMTGAKE